MPDSQNQHSDDHERIIKMEGKLNSMCNSLTRIEKKLDRVEETRNCKNNAETINWMKKRMVCEVHTEKISKLEKITYGLVLGTFMLAIKAVFDLIAG
jgi:hypothetical protein